MDDRVMDVLDQVRPIYDDIRRLQNDRNNLNDVRAAAAERDAVLERGKKLLAAAELRVRNLTQELNAPKPDPKPDRANPDLIVDRPSAVGSVSSRTAWQTSNDKPPDPIPPPQPERQEQRTEIKNLVGRFLRYRLNAEQPALLEQFNALMNDEGRPVGEALTLLDFDTAYATPFGRSEQNAPEKWVARLQKWGAALEQYRTALIGDIDALRQRYSALLGILDRYRDRAAHPEHWNDWLEDTRREQDGKLAVAEAAAADLQRQIEAKKQGR